MGIPVPFGVERSEFLGHPRSSVSWFHPHSGGLSSRPGSERSDELHGLPVGLELGGTDLAHGAALEFEFVGGMDEPVADRVGEGRFSERFMPG